MNYQNSLKYIRDGALDASLVSLYGKAALDSQRKRYIHALSEFASMYGEDCDISIFSVSGRSELSGNHTDHNHGKVIAASVDLDIIAVATKTENNTVRLKSEGYREDVVDLNKFSSPQEELFGTSSALIAGVGAGFLKKDYNIGGFCAYTTSNVLKGSGLSSSAAFENMIGNIFNHFYNDGKIDNVDIAKISQFSENTFFGKPCGLMDQIACAVGGIVAIDFESTTEPKIESICFNPSDEGYNLCIVNTGGNHANLTDDYASVPAEMKAVAKELGVSLLRETSREKLLEKASELRHTVGDRAILRAMHFFAENERVDAQKEALLAKDLDLFFAHLLNSGRSSFCYLQNVYTTKNVSEQGLSLALCLAEQLLANKGGAWRVHGGGFAGTIQAFVPQNCLNSFKKTMENIFGKDSCIVLKIRSQGAIKIL